MRSSRSVNRRPRLYTTCSHAYSCIQFSAPSEDLNLTPRSSYASRCNTTNAFHCNLFFDTGHKSRKAYLNQYCSPSFALHPFAKRMEDLGLLYTHILCVKPIRIRCARDRLASDHPNAVSDDVGESWIIHAIQHLHP